MLKPNGPVLAVLLAGLAATLTATVSHAANPAATPAESSRSAELARLVQPQKLIIDAAIVQYDRVFVATMREQADIRALEDEYPGVTDAAYKELRPLMLAELERGIPELWHRVAALYDKHFDQAELAELIRFYSGPTGQKLIRLANSGRELEPMMREMVSREDMSISEKSVEEANKSLVAEALGQLAPSDVMVLTELMQSPLGAKLRDIKPDMTKLTLEWTNEPNPAFEKKVEQVTEAAMMRFIESQVESR
jgi:hypothetical protein